MLHGPSSILALALLPLALSLASPLSSSLIHTEPHLIKRGSGDLTRYVTMVIKPPAQKVALANTPKILYLDDSRQVVEVFLTDIILINQHDQEKGGALDRKRTIRAFQFNPGPGEKPIDCTLDIDETVPWVDDEVENRAIFTFQARAEYLWPCGLPDKETRKWATVNCPLTQVVCDKAAWPEKA